jgi:hypothetical protein
MAGRIQARVDDNILKNLRELEVENNISRADLIRELLELGLKEKQKQQENIKTKQPQWDEYYRQIAGRNDVAYRLQLEILESLIVDKKSLNEIKNKAINNAKEFRENILHKDIT